MSKLSNHVSYLKGLAEGLELKEETAEQKLLLKIIEVLDEFAKDAEEVKEALRDFGECIDNIDEDLGDLEELIFSEEDDSCCCHEEEDGVVEYECPHCGYDTHFDVSDFDLEEDYRCPSCSQPLFPETEDDEDDE